MILLPGHNASDQYYDNSALKYFSLRRLYSLNALSTYAYHIRLFDYAFIRYVYANLALVIHFLLCFVVQMNNALYTPRSISNLLQINAVRYHTHTVLGTVILLCSVFIFFVLLLTNPTLSSS